MNRRRTLLVLLATAALVPFRVFSQLKDSQQGTGKVVRIGMLSETTRTSVATGDKRFITAMQALGWVEGHNVVYDQVYADDDLTRVPGLAAELVARRPDVIHVRSTQPALAVASATRTIPIVFVTLSDPLQKGLVKSFARPGGNVTGATGAGADVGGKRLQLLKQAMPRLTRVGPVVFGGQSERLQGGAGGGGHPWRDDISCERKRAK